MNWADYTTFAISALAIINGLMLLRTYLRDRPTLEVNPIHPNLYQWFFKLPNRVVDGKTTRRYGFLAYIGIDNKGIRDVSLNQWHLFVTIKNGKLVELKPISIPEPKIKLGESANIKVYPVLGASGLFLRRQYD